MYESIICISWGPTKSFSTQQCLLRINPCVSVHVVGVSSPAPSVEFKMPPPIPSHLSTHTAPPALSPPTHKENMHRHSPSVRPMEEDRERRHRLDAAYLTRWVSRKSLSCNSCPYSPWPWIYWSRTKMVQV